VTSGTPRFDPETVPFWNLEREYKRSGIEVGNQIGSTHPGNVRVTGGRH